jgi:small-conductance mechanosensitive channel
MVANDAVTATDRMRKRHGSVERIGMHFWERALVAGLVIAVALTVAKLVDTAIERRLRTPEAITRYRVLRRALTAAIVIVGVLSSLLVIPQVRAVAGGLLASSAILGLIIGFASQRTLGNFVAGLMLALTQPLRICDTVQVTGVTGTVEEIGLVYTFIRTPDGDRLVIPNEKLASDTIRNYTIRSPEKVALVTVQVPSTSDLDSLVDALRVELPPEGGDVVVRSIEGSPTLLVRATVAPDGDVEAVENELRLRVHGRLRAAGALS